MLAATFTCEHLVRVIFYTVQQGGGFVNDFFAARENCSAACVNKTDARKIYPAACKSYRGKFIRTKRIYPAYCRRKPINRKTAEKKDRNFVTVF